MFQRLQLKLLLIKISLDGLCQKLEEQVMIKGDQIEIKLTTIDLHSEANVTQKIELEQDVILDQVLEAKQQNLEHSVT